MIALYDSIIRIKTHNNNILYIIIIICMHALLRSVAAVTNGIEYKVERDNVIIIWYTSQVKYFK